MHQPPNHNNNNPTSKEGTPHIGEHSSSSLGSPHPSAHQQHHQRVSSGSGGGEQHFLSSPYVGGGEYPPSHSQHQRHRSHSNSGHQQHPSSTPYQQPQQPYHSPTWGAANYYESGIGEDHYHHQQQHSSYYDHQHSSHHHQGGSGMAAPWQTLPPIPYQYNSHHHNSQQHQQSSAPSTPYLAGSTPTLAAHVTPQHPSGIPTTNVPASHRNSVHKLRGRQLSLSSSVGSACRSRQNSTIDFGTSPTAPSMPARRTSQSPSFVYQSNNPSFQNSNSFSGPPLEGPPSAAGGGGGDQHSQHHRGTGSSRRVSGGTPHGASLNPGGGGGGNNNSTSPVALLTSSPHPDRATLPDVIVARAYDGDYGEDAETNHNNQSGSAAKTNATTTAAIGDVGELRRSSSGGVDPLDGTRKPESGDMEGVLEEVQQATTTTTTPATPPARPTNRVHVRSARIVSTTVTREELLGEEAIVCGDFFLRSGCAMGANCTMVHVVGREHVWEPITLPSEIQTRWTRRNSQGGCGGGISGAAASTTSTKDCLDSTTNTIIDNSFDGKHHHPLNGDPSSNSKEDNELAEVCKLRAVQYPKGFNLFTYDTSMTTYLRIPSDKIERTLGSEMFIECYNNFGGNFKTQFSLCADFDPAIDMAFEGNAVSDGGCVVPSGHHHQDHLSNTQHLQQTTSTLNATTCSDVTTGGVADEEEDEMRAVEPRPRRGCPMGAQCPRIHCLEFDPVVTCKYSQTHMVLDEDVDTFASSRAKYDEEHGQYASTYYYLPLLNADASPNSDHLSSTQQQQPSRQRTNSSQRASQLAAPSYLTTTTMEMFASLPTPPQLCPWYSRLSSSIPSIVESSAHQSAHRSHHHRRRSSAASSQQTAATAAADAGSASGAASTSTVQPTTTVELPRYYVRVYPQNCPPNVRDDFEDIPIDAVLVTEGSNCFLRAIRSLVVKATQSCVLASGRTSRKQSTTDISDALAAAGSKTNSPSTTHLSVPSRMSNSPPSRRVSIGSQQRNRPAPLRLTVQTISNDHVIVTPITVKQPQHCAHFRLKQLCRKGPDCRFVHVLPGYPATRLGGGGTAPNSLGNSHTTPKEEALTGQIRRKSNNNRNSDNNNSSRPSRRQHSNSGGPSHGGYNTVSASAPFTNNNNAGGHHLHNNNYGQQHSLHTSAASHDTPFDSYSPTYNNTHHHHHHQHHHADPYSGGGGIGSSVGLNNSDDYYSQHHDWHQQQQQQHHYGGGGGDPNYAHTQGGGGGGPSSWTATPYNNINNDTPQPSGSSTTSRPKPIDASNSPSEGQISVSPAKSPTAARHTNNPYRFN